jgi:hypothetical protein
MHTGWTTGQPIARPSLRNGLRLTSCSPRGVEPYCPRRLVDHWRRRPVGRRAPPRDLTPDSGVRTTRLGRPRTSSLGLRELACAHARSHAKTLSASCRTRGGNCSRQGRPAIPIAPDAVASIATLPAVRDDRDPPLSRPGWFVCTVNQNFGKVEYFWRGGLTGEVGELRGVFCPTGDKAAAIPPTVAPSGGHRLFP